MEHLEQKTLKELRQIARQVGISYIAECKKAELIQRIKHEETLRNTPTPAGKRVIGYYLDGSPILEDIDKPK
jgi:Rho termination factor, N-terminal domain